MSLIPLPVTQPVSQPLSVERRELRKMRMSDDLRGKASTVPREALCLLSVPNEWRRLRRVGSISKVFILPETLRD